MSAPLVLTLACCVTSLVVLWVALRARFWTHIGALFVLMAVIFHGLSEVVARLRPEDNFYRLLVSQDRVDDWLMWAGPAILVLTAAYLVTLRSARLRHPSEDVEGANDTAKFLNWRYCLLATAPLYLISLWGRGFVPGPVEEGDYFEAGLASQFLLLGVVLTAFALVLRTGRFLPVVIVQSVALLLLGRRTAVVAGIAVLCFLMSRHNFRFRRPQVILLAAIGIVGSILLSASRASVGPEEFASGRGPADRVSALGAGTTLILGGDGYDEVRRDFLYRIDGNAFPALILEQQANGGTPTGLVTLVDGLELVVPSFSDPTTTDAPETVRTEKAYIVDHYGLPRRIDYLPTFLGGAVSYFGSWPLLLLAAALGVALGATDRALKSNGPVRSIIAAGVLSCVIHYEQGVTVVPITMRGALLLAGLVWALTMVRRIVFRARQAPSATLPAQS